jgi:hypothetical protein
MRSWRVFPILVLAGLCAFPVFGSDSPVEVQDITPEVEISTIPPPSLKEEAPAKKPAKFLPFLDHSKTISQSSLYDEYRHQSNGDGVHYITPRFDFSPTSDIYFRLDIPYVVSQPKDGSQEEGMGDVLCRGLYRIKKFTRNALRGGFDAYLDTAKNGMGDGTNVVAPIMNGTFVVSSKVRLQPWILYYHSLSETSSGSDIRNLRAKLFTNVSWNKRWASEFELQYRNDLTGIKNDTVLVEAELTRVVLHGPGFYARPGVRLTGDQAYDWKFEGGITWNY